MYIIERRVQQSERLWCQVCGYVTQGYIEDQCPRLDECHMLPDENVTPAVAGRSKLENNQD